MRVGFEGASSGGVIVVIILVCESTVVLFSFSESTSGIVETVLNVFSSRFMLMTGISRAVFMNFSSIDGGSPFLTMRSAFARSTSRSLGCDRRYMDSSPASTVSHVLRIFVSIIVLRVGHCDKSVFQCGDEDARVSR